MPSKAGDPRWSAEWKRLRARLVAAASHCAACGGPLLKDAPPRSRWRPSVDHIIPVRVRPDLALDPSNVRVLHASCNTRKENTSRRGSGRYHGGPRWGHQRAAQPAPRPTWQSRRW